MNITVIGLGYVGLTNALYLASHHHVFGFDTDYKKINELQEGKTFLLEKDLQKFLTKHSKNLTFGHEVASMLAVADVVLLAVPTPEGDQGKIDLSAIEESFQSIIKDGKKGLIVLVRSTVIPGTQQHLVALAKKHKRPDIHIVALPEFLSLGHAMEDTLKPKRMVVGIDDQSLKPIILKIFRYPNSIPFVFTNPQTAELIKYASNGFLATKVSFINEMSQIAEKTGANIDQVVEGMSFDPRIGGHFLQPGIGFGGSCFPKDLKALHHLASDHQLDSQIVSATLQTNQQQVTQFMNRVLDRFSGQIKQKKIAVLGLSFKGSTSDVRNSPAFQVIDMLTDKEAIIFAYDKFATFDFFNVRGEKPCLAYAVEIEDALKDADAAIIVNDAMEIKELTANDFKKLMKTPLVFDGRNLYEPSKMKGVEYHSVGRPSTKI
jgi:UDPglucose 6-dehydrogenase